ncbi:MAG: nucleotide pyrophosphohydrolase [Promethearchaeota archaeon]
MRKFRDDRNWNKYHDPKDIVLAIFIEAGELAEHFLWKNLEDIKNYLSSEGYREQIMDEVADVFIYLMNLINVLEELSGKQVDVKKEILRKIAKNEKKYPVDGKMP